MKTRNLAACVVGFLAGAAALAGGGEEEQLRAELDALQREAARLARPAPDPLRIPDPPPPDERELAIFPVGDIETRRVDFLPPRLDSALASGGSPFGGTEWEVPPGADSHEELTELVRFNVDPQVWERSRILPLGRSIVSNAPPATNRRIAEFLDRGLRSRAHRDVVVDLEIRKAPGGSHPRPGVLSEAELARVREGALVCALRGTGSLGSRFYVWCGGEIALLPDLDVEIGPAASVTDPNIDVLRTGVLLAVRAVPIGESGDLLLDSVIRTRWIDEMRTRTTARTGLLDAPATRMLDAAALLRAPRGRWVVATRGHAASQGGCVAILRARIVERRAGR